MKKVFLSIALALLMVPFISFAEEGEKVEANSSVATATINGSVFDKLSGESLGGAEIEIVGTDVKSYTDFDGNFSLPALPPGTYSITVSYISYEKSLIEEFTVEAGQAKDVKVNLISAR